MVSKTCVFMLICVGLSVAIQSSLPRAFALQRSPNVEEFVVGDQGTRLQQDYVLERALENAYLKDMDFIGPMYSVDALPRPGAKLLPDRFLDYADMIRNDIILLDDSVETRTRKPGNIKVKKQNDAIPDVPCKCENGSESIDLTKDWGIVYPYMVRNLTCSDICEKPYICQRKIYNLTVLKKRPEALTWNWSDIYKLNHGYDMPMPNDLVRRWTPKTIPITTGCQCTLP